MHKQLLLLFFFCLFIESSNAQCTITGNQTSYGASAWIGYVYANTNGGNPPSNAFTTTYQGFVNQPEIFDQNLGSGSISGTNLCGTYANNFAVRYKMNKTMPAGTYNFTVGGDDGYRLSIDGGTTYIINNWNDHGYVSSTTSVYLSGNTNFVLEYFETGGDSRVSFNYTVDPCSTAPTSITGNNNICNGFATTLTATGGSANSSTTYQWGTGTVGSNIIAGQTASSITVTPSTSTTYWVRRIDSSPCNVTTGAASQLVTVNPNPGDQTSYGSNSWIGYVYAPTNTGNPPSNAFTTNYIGYITQSEMFNLDLVNGSISGPNLCSSYADYFAIRFKMQENLDAGYYTFTVGGDDGYRLSVDGGATFLTNLSDWTGHAYQSKTATVYLSGNTNFVLEYFESGGQSRVSFNYTVCKTSTAPTSISGASTLCTGEGGTTLIATGGVLASNSVYQWGTGSTIGSNVIAGQTTANYVINPSVTTTYWTRIIDCSTYNTTGITKTITVNTGTTAGTLSSTATTICKNTSPNPITIVGNVGSITKWQYANDNAFTSGVTDIASTATTLTSALMGNISATRYYRAVVQSGSCPIKNTVPIAITVPASLTYSNGAWNGTPNATTPVVISDNLTLTNDLSVCSCQVSNGYTLTVESDKNLIIQTTLTVDTNSNLIVKNNGSIVQAKDNYTNSGDITYIRSTTPIDKFDYTYWSTPVSPQTLLKLSPNTAGGKFYSFNEAIDDWKQEDNSITMVNGKGYIIRGPQDYVSPQPLSVFDGIFKGVPNNGVITIGIGIAGNSNLLGNPYPSALDASSFLTANSSLLEGTIYLWTHNTDISLNTPNPGSGTYAYSSDDYASYNLTGGVGTAKAISSTNSGAVNANIPTGKIASGQAFFTTSKAIGTATFNNTMRVGANGITGTNNQFFKFSSNSKTTDNKSIEKNRLWLDLYNDQGAFKQTLIGYVTDATDAYDDSFDGESFDGNQFVDFYSINEDKVLTIQGRALPFKDTDIVPIGYTTVIDGDFSIGIDQVDGDFTTQVVYLEDKLLDITHNLTEKPYDFTTEKGVFNDRFEIKYTNKTLGTDTFTPSNSNFAVYKKGKQIKLDSQTKLIQSVQIFNISGKLIYSQKEINNLKFSTTDLSINNQVVIVKTTLEDKEIITTKVIL
ncbi:T9SS sorting signal type C domain-containing protein [Flavobacterium sp. WC2430]|uniref:T9SS sorting signal type C domain-containing protein n=1 Tax=Flavobacterium sp. WC2430 TaxID=3234137 RepID=UPI0034662E7D